MDFAEYKDILVVLELDEGKTVNVSLENIAAAKSVANGGRLLLLQFVKMLQRQQLNMAQTAQSLLKALSLKVTMQMQLQML